MLRVGYKSVFLLRTDPIRFLAGCRKNRLNQGWSILLCLVLGFVVFIMAVVGLVSHRAKRSAGKTRP